MPGWKTLPDELDPDVRAFTELLRRLVDRSGLAVAAVAERTGHERAVWDAFLNARQPVPRSAVMALADVTGSDSGGLAAHWERAERVWSGRVAGEGGGGSAPTAGGGARGDGDRDSGRGDGDRRARDDRHDESDRTMQIRRIDLPSPAPAPDPAAAPTPAPAPVSTPAPTPASRRHRVLLYVVGTLGALLVVTAALLLVDLGGSDGADDRAAAPSPTTAPPATRPPSLPPGVRCAGADCTGQDPEAMGCGGELATTVARARVGTALIEVRYSGTCGAAWARITGAAPGDTVSVEAASTVRNATVAPDADTAAATDAYTPMVAVGSGTAARACGALANGREGCTAGD
ncbi:MULTISPECIES: DUF2690 domain-containing protein [unclassified Streptomyces]|uniref:DUF2690 domain-containing protein n=1 Tax=unclassified Streptomyces TaxID=2593676 RepID=UPI0006F72FEF|nr:MULTISPECIES: DUF2690 domain-containing protein [unclassified Streptomyces]KQX59067.1 hypothetical protein ASD33_01830 [Streptomyces sp. Root1304]KRB00329.1 hypothetical protein ASE09_01830 [Streptomyces sp. Root66D1]